MNILDNFKTWNEAATWLARHGYGIGSIQDLKIEWDQVHSVITELSTTTLIEEVTLAPEPTVIITEPVVPEPAVEEPETLAVASEVVEEVTEETTEE
jgi:hypothetical protein